MLEVRPPENIDFSKDVVSHFANIRAIQKMPLNPKQAEKMPDIQRRVDQLNTELKELARDATKHGFNILIVTNQGRLKITPETMQQIHKVVTFKLPRN